jgi:tetratricopeptide (TPR) repeat protein
VREGPLLILCLARPELIDVRAEWGGGRVRSTSIELEPLALADSETLIDALSADISAETRHVLLQKTEGNPLFLEETIRMVEESGEGSAERIPDTLQALIAARIDRLPPASKIVLQRTSVIGRGFWAGAVAHLAPDVDGIEQALQDLLLRDFIVGEPRSTISGETAYRFRHVLIRDVAYTSLSKTARADHHARFADWLGERAGEELLEIRAHHLDHAASLLAELDGAPPADLAREAAATLQEAGRRSLAREANQAARHALLRALELEPTLERRYLAAKAAWRLDDLPAVSREMEVVRADAIRAGDRQFEGRALTALADMALMREADPTRSRELADQALAVLDESEPGHLFDALRVRANAAYWVGDLTDSEQYLREQLAVARRAGRKDLESVAILARADIHRAKLELDEARPLLTEAIRLAEETGVIASRGRALLFLGRISLLKGHFEQAEEAAEEARRLFSEAGAVWAVARALNLGAWAAWESGDLEKAEKRFRESVKMLKQIGDRATLCESQRGLAELLLARGRVDEAERFALDARETVGPLDVTSRATTTASLGMVRAAQARDDEAEELLREAVATVAGTHFREHEYETLAPLAQFLRERGREEEAERVDARRAEIFPPFDKSAAPIA